MVNNNLFRIKIENFHPILDKYSRISYWKEMKKFCMEGYWVGGTWMCGELFYYINFHNINKEKGSYKGLGLPDLRDIDWEIFNIYTEAIGFSGFELDEENTCHRAIEELNKGELTKEEVIVDYCTENGVKNDKLYYSLFKLDDTPKKYIPARDYLRKIHPKNLGKPLYQNESKHLLLLGSRGFGKSFSASGLIAHNFLFDGSHDYDLYRESIDLKKRLKSETGVGAIDAKYSGDLLDKVRVAFEHLPDRHEIYDGRNLKVYPSLLEKNISGSFMPSKKVEASDSKSVIHHRTLQDNPLVFNGTRPNRVFLDEVGFISNLLEAWESLEATQAAEKFKRLTIYGMGTGGLSSGAAVTFSQRIFYDPETYNCLVFDDKWENKGKICYFVPGTFALNKYKEGPNFITNEARALAAIEKEREAAKKSKNSTKIQGVVINKPLVPSEVFLRMEGTFFPTQELKQALGELEANSILLRSSYKVDLVERVKGKIEMVPSEKVPIINFPLMKDDNMDACIEIFQKPKLDAEGNVFSNRYVLGCLPPGEKVMTNQGLKNIEEVTLKNKLINEKGNLVDIINTQKYNVKNEDLYEIKVANTFRTTKFTKEHPILVSERKTRFISYPKSVRLGISQRYYEFNYKYKKASDITTNDWIKVPNIYKKVIEPSYSKLWNNEGYRIDRQIKNPLNNPNFWWFVGMWLGDGWSSNNEYTIHCAINSKEDVYIEKYIDIVNKLFKREVSRVINKKGTCTELVFCHQQLNRFMTDTFGKGANGKYIPEWVKYLDKEKKLKLLQGYLDSDGSIIKLGNYYSSEFVSINLELIESFQDILFSLGIYSGLSKLRDETAHIIAGKEVNCKEAYHLRAAHQDTLKLVNLIDDRSDIKIARIDFDNLPLVRRNPKNNCHFDETEDFIYFKIIDINKTKYTGNVYNFKCDTHTFMCHHITTHNCDPVDDDGNDDIKRSLQSTHILDTWTDEIVCEYSARTYLASEYYENVRKLCVMYNGKLLYENNRKGLYGHFNNKHALHYLAETPQILKDQDLLKSTGVGNRSLGINMSSDKIKLYGINLILEWLEKPSYRNPEIKNLYTIRSQALLKELISFSMDINADRVSALIALMIYRAELDFQIESIKKNGVKQTTQSSFWGNAYKSFGKDKVHKQMQNLLNNYDVE